MSLPTPQEVLTQLKWRYAVKQFDPQRKIDAELWQTLEESLVLTPSSFGLQPWKFVVVTSHEIRKTLVEHAWGQTQVADCSHFVVLCIRKNVDLAYVDRNLARIETVRGTPVASLAGLRNLIGGFLSNASLDVDSWAAHQVYIALGQFMATAAVLGIDTCPMEGIAAARFDEVLDLVGTDYATQVAVCAGYRAATDRYATMAKVRFDHSDVIEWR